MPTFLFLTAKVEASEIRHGMNLGADDYILKPFEHSELLKIIKLRLEKRGENAKLNNWSIKFKTLSKRVQ